MTGIVLLILRFLLTASLFLFVGAAFYLLWKDLAMQGRLLAERVPVPIGLERIQPVAAAPVQFQTVEVIIGRSPACSVIADDHTVSARHARLVYRQRQWWAEDLFSTNGTFINDVQINTPMVVTQGDKLRCGQAIFVISLGEKEITSHG